MAPILAQLRTEYAGRLLVDVYDVRKRPEVSREFGVRIIPTQIFYNPAGEELWRHEGYMSKQDILHKWKELGVELSSAAGEQAVSEARR
jgi:thioredoxin 1